MLVIFQGNTYRIPIDVVNEAGEEFTSGLEAVFAEIKKSSAECAEIAETERETDALMLLRLRQPPISDMMLTTMANVFNKIRSSHSIEQWKTSMKPSEVKHKLHGEAGQAYDLDANQIITCEDCYLRALAFLSDTNRAKSLMKMNKEDVTVDDQVFLFKHAMECMGIDTDAPDGEDGARIMMLNAETGVMEQISADDVEKLIRGSAPSEETPESQRASAIRPTHIPKVNRLN